MTYLRQITYQPNLLDAFFRLRTSEPFTLFDSAQILSDQSLLWTTSLAGGAPAQTYVNARSSTLLNVSGAGQTSIRQTKQYLTYQPGKGLTIKTTFVMGAPVAELVRRVGYFDGTNGIFLEQNGTVGVNLVRRSSVTVTEVVPQADWNLDKLNGQGPSGVTLDLTNSQLFFVALEWLGTGSAFAGFFFNGVPVLVHRFDTANVIPSVYIRTPNLPVRYEISTGAGYGGGAQTLEQICCSVESDGGYQPRGQLRSADMGTTTRAVAAGAFVPLISIRLAPGFERGALLPEALSALVTTADNMRFALMLNPTITTPPLPVWTSAGTGSIAQFDVTRSGAITDPGVRIHSGYISQVTRQVSLPQASVIPVVSNFAGVPDELVLGVQAFTALQAVGALTWREIQ